jgi:hypothetical protein
VAALAQAVLSAVVSKNSISSSGYLLDTPVAFRSAPELFRLDLYRYFDVDVFTAMASPAIVSIADPNPKSE